MNEKLLIIFWGGVDEPMPFVKDAFYSFQGCCIVSPTVTL